VRRRQFFARIGMVHAFVVFGAASLVAQQPAGAPTSVSDTLTIEQAVQEALDHNPQLAAKKRDVDVAETQSITAALRPNPVLSLSGDHLDWLGTGFDEENGGGPTELAARVDFAFERGQKRERRLLNASAAKASADAGVSDAIRTLRLTVELACIDVIQANDNLTLTRDTLRTFSDLVTLNDERVSSGAAAPSEATRTRVAMLQFQANVSRAELALRAASIQLTQLLGRPASNVVLTVVGPTIAPVSAQPLDVPGLQALALEHRTDLQSARLAEAQSVADLRLQEAIGKIDYTVGTEYRRQTGPLSKSNSLGVFFSAPLPISNRNQGEIARAFAERDQNGLETDAVEATVRADVQSAFESYVSSGALVTSIQRDLLPAAQSARDTAEYTYRAQATTLVELIDSQRAWNDAMQTYADAQSDYRRAVAHLNAAVGMVVVR
jgi:cobalt-zinc-cadmium efflux system outer membrane protein